jgi:hypothetical protein
VEGGGLTMYVIYYCDGVCAGYQLSYWGSLFEIQILTDCCWMIPGTVDIMED